MKKQVMILLFVAIAMVSCEKNQVSKKEDLNLSFLDKNEFLITTIYNGEDKIVNRDLLNKLGKMKTFDEVDNLFEQFGVPRSVSIKIVEKMKEDYQNFNKYRIANNIKITQLTKKQKIDFINETIDLNSKYSSNLVLNSVSCGDRFNTGLDGCDRNYVFDKLGNLLSLGFENGWIPVANYLKGEAEALQNLFNCQDDAYDKYLTCLTS